MPHASAHLSRPRTFVALVALLASVLAPMVTGATRADAAAQPAHVAGGWDFVKFPAPNDMVIGGACAGVGLISPGEFVRTECAFARFGLTPAVEAGETVRVDFVLKGDNEPFHTQNATLRTDGRWQYRITPELDWPAGEVRVVVYVGDETTSAGETTFLFNILGAGINVADSATGYQPGDDIPMTVDLHTTPREGVHEPAAGATFSLEAARPDGSTEVFGPFTADGNGQHEFTLPGSFTSDLEAGPDSGFRSVIAVSVVDAAHTDPVTGEWSAERTGTAAATVFSPPDALVVESQFVSSVGWVKPGEAYPFRVSVRNFSTTPRTGAVVTVPPVEGTTYLGAKPLGDAGTATVRGDGSIEWQVGNVAAGDTKFPATKQLIVQAVADTLEQDPELVWKDLSATALLTYDGGPSDLSNRALGPKVIPVDERWDTARYGHRPFPVVPVDYTDRKHDASNTGDRISAIINSPDVPGSTRNLFDELSYGQLRPEGAVPSSGIATAGWDVEWSSPRYQEGGWQFTQLAPNGTCLGVTEGDFVGDSPRTAERINGGWYQLPGDTGYYGTDKYSAASLAGAVAGVGLLFDIDNACGPTGKAVYDAAHIADPEIDYNEFDTDKDGVVDFFMMLFVGIGGNGASQLQGTPPYDNIWPHSSSLEFYYTDPETGLSGYVSDDRLTDLEGNELFYTDETYTSYTTQDTGLPAYVRVGPYNVNPETSVSKASVISHEYGHSLGLPDYYSIDATRETYGTWNLMAADHQQFMDTHARQDMGWIVPEELPKGSYTIEGWRDGKIDTHRIAWQRPDGTPYVLEGPDVHNGEAYNVKLPGKILIDPAKFETGGSSSHVWWSGSGNDFLCPPEAGHNFDVYLPELEDVEPGTPVTLEFASLFDIEWDFDYGFVMISTDGGESYTSLPSQNGTTSNSNPNANSCQQKYGNGISGTSTSYANGTAEVDRALGEYPDPVFITDSFDLSAAAGSPTVLRFSYATDPGLARPGWFIDDVRVTAGDDVIYTSDFEATDDEPRLFNGGCKESVKVASTCTPGWTWISAIEGSPADHGYYLEMRDRSSFDLNGKGQSDRGDPTWSPGLYLQYTDEARGYGNVGVDGAPAQSPLDSQPDPGNEAPNLDDAAFTAADLDRQFSDFGEGWTDNYVDDQSEDGLWHFAYDCLEFEVLSMRGSDLGPLVPPYDLEGDVRFTVGDGCAAFPYGLRAANTQETPDSSKPTAKAQAKPTSVAVGEQVTFDGSASTDDDDAASELDYAWDFGDGNGAEGQVVRHAYSQAGTYTATLTVTDTAGNASTDTIEIVVGAGPGGGAALPSTGGGLALLGLLAAGGALALRRRG